MIQDSVESIGDITIPTSDESGGSNAWAGADEGSQPGRAVSTIEDLPMQLGNIAFRSARCNHPVAGIFC